MKKIPLESTIVGSYKFLFTNIISIIGVVWFPILLLGALIWGLTCQIVPHEWWQGKFAFDQIEGVVVSHLPLIVSGALAIVIVGLLVRAMILVGVLRHAVGEKTSTTFIYFSLGARVWLMIVVVLFGVFMAILLEVAAGILYAAVGGIMAAIPQIPTGVVALVNGLLGIVVAVAVIYVMLRLFFFLPAVVVAERRLGVGRAWTLGKGNVLRMIVVMIAVMIPVSIVVSAAFYLTVVPTVIFEAIRQKPNTEQEAIAFLQSLWPLLPAIGAIMLVTMIAALGLALGAIGRAYTAVAAPEPVEVPAAAAPAAPEEPDAPETPETPDAPEASEASDTSDAPDASDTPDAPEGGDTDD